MKFELRWESRRIVVVLCYCDGAVYGGIARFVTDEDYPNGGGALEMGKGNDGYKVGVESIFRFRGVRSTLFQKDLGSTNS
ncbi:hypothetical protein M9H77_18495 [Catharanthus roseus]|uniref:Uncharacterized protein n=1 Tax=Catharanthus roseus TaxID=4058 RepID=A0ACC0B7K7_CATRO|nr:hypothetical protein M9H77_18495 [Catharanthus roseus]